MKYQPALDGLRGIGAVFVVYAHADSLQNPPGAWAWLDMFFVLSGYLITTILLNEIARSGKIDFRAFYLKRALRLAPGFICMLLFVLLATCFIWSYNRDYFKDVLMASLCLMNWNRAFGWVPGNGGIIGQTWSLCVEEQFYLIWPVTLIFLLRSRRAAPFLMLGVICGLILWRLYLASIGAGFNRISNGFDTHSDGLLLGCLIGLVPDLVSKLTPLARRFLAMPIGIFIVIVATATFYGPFAQTIGTTLAALCTGWVIIGISKGGIVDKLLSLKPFVYTGRLSYSWYVWHLPLLFVIRNYLPKTGTLELIVITYAAAMLSFHLIESPFLRIKKCLRPHHPIFLPPTEGPTAIAWTP
jgi:peptidoglycan/LPS O-acetylase OafA/YrhL